ncbi:hypothetical protein Flavo103_33650 [Flavobacterium collinsii]|uniref:hypothetical protein n=1 Tax=Flavobacterium collinsii TaxID=1114861 RepID=UPI0022C0C83E|nr:hypothetical protein [Flavobacterium collinsii]GIQ60229.1 hypothetical protein Flavo103_33650 [Flavobacterium collinsii]
MKNLKRISLLFVVLVLMISCTSMKNNNSTVTGKVDAIESGKDGYTAKISTAAKEVYFATISIVNVGGPQNYKTLKIGNVVSVKGEIWKTEDESHIKVTQIISVK